jgi:hypothetical protein
LPFWKAADVKSVGVKCDFLGTRILQRSGKVERKFHIFYGRIRSMLNGASLKDEVRSTIWAELAMTTTYLSNFFANKCGKKCPCELLIVCKPQLILILKTFGEIGVITTKDKIQFKLRNRGSTCIFDGFTENHSRDMFRMLNLEANGLINSIDVCCLEKMYED